ncbi:ATP:cob(I)alamin adenosyltransferase [gamma proteobacterium HdN1]|nr:ATP:cob(I)alamin adenosyltransferase [gamma proteobacterium HdN1]
MGHRLSKIYTRTGDKGTTGLGDGSRVEKDDLRVEAYGTVDELNSTIGVLLAEPLPAPLPDWLSEIQHDLFDLGGELCIPGYKTITDDYITRLEKWLDEINEPLPMLKEFILPGGSRGAAQCHVARTICRRAERRVYSFAKHDGSTDSGPMRYLNRLSDFLFVAARVIARADHGQEVLWDRKRFEKPAAP